MRCRAHQRLAVYVFAATGAIGAATFGQGQQPPDCFVTIQDTACAPGGSDAGCPAAVMLVNPSCPWYRDVGFNETGTEPPISSWDALCRKRIYVDTGDPFGCQGAIIQYITPCAQPVGYQSCAGGGVA